MADADRRPPPLRSAAAIFRDTFSLLRFVLLFITLLSFSVDASISILLIRVGYIMNSTDAVRERAEQRARDEAAGAAAGPAGRRAGRNRSAPAPAPGNGSSRRRGSGSTGRRANGAAAGSPAGGADESAAAGENLTSTATAAATPAPDNSDGDDGLSQENRAHLHTRRLSNGVTIAIITAILHMALMGPHRYFHVSPALRGWLQGGGNGGSTATEASLALVFAEQVSYWDAYLRDLSFFAPFAMPIDSYALLPVWFVFLLDVSFFLVDMLLCACMRPDREAALRRGIEAWHAGVRRHRDAALRRRRRRDRSAGALAAAAFSPDTAGGEGKLATAPAPQPHRQSPHLQPYATARRHRGREGDADDMASLSAAVVSMSSVVLVAHYGSNASACRAAGDTVIASGGAAGGEFESESADYGTEREGEGLGAAARALSTADGAPTAGTDAGVGKLVKPAAGADADDGFFSRTEVGGWDEDPGEYRGGGGGVPKGATLLRRLAQAAWSVVCLALRAVSCGWCRCCCCWTRAPRSPPLPPSDRRRATDGHPVSRHRRRYRRCARASKSALRSLFTGWSLQLISVVPPPGAPPPPPLHPSVSTAESPSPPPPSHTE